jgi:DNA-binding beta-propeller fold protein YncE
MRWIAVLSVVLLGLTAASASATYDYVTSWGGTGNAQNRFHAPGAIAYGASDVYTTDYELDRVQQWTTSGHFVRTWGSFGAHDGELNSPEDIAVGPGTQNVYVADTGNDRIAEFTPDGGFLRNWGTSGTGNRQFDEPHGVVAGNNYPDDRVYVADTGNDRIQEFTYSGGFIRTFGGSHLNSPFGIAISPASRRVYVGNVGTDRIAEFSSSGSFIRSWAVTGTLYPPSTLDVDYLGRVYVADKDRILVYGPKGGLITTWGETGYGANNLFETWGLALDHAYNGYIYVGDNRYGGTTFQQGVKKFQIVYPETTITAGPLNNVVIADSTPTFSFTSSVPNSTFQCRHDSKPWSPCSSPRTTVSLADGKHTWDARAVDPDELRDLSPASRVFTVDTTATVDIPSGPITLTPTGKANVAVTCPASEPSGGCGGTLTLRTHNQVNFNGQNQKVVLGTANFLIASGQTRTLGVQLSAAKQQLVADNDPLPTDAIASVQDGLGNTGTTTQTFDLSAP